MYTYNLPLSILINNRALKPSEFKMNAILDFARFLSSGCFVGDLGFILGGFCRGGLCLGCFVWGFMRVGGVLSGGVLSGGFLSGGVLSGGFCPGGFVRGVLSGGFCPGGFVRGGFVRGVLWFRAQNSADRERSDLPPEHQPPRWRAGNVELDRYPQLMMPGGRKTLICPTSNRTFQRSLRRSWAEV